MRYSLLTAVISSTLLVSCASQEAPNKHARAIESFRGMQSTDQKLSYKELNVVNKAAHDHMEKIAITPAERLQFPAYLAMAQKEYADLTEEVNGSYTGSFAPVTIAVVRLFDPEANIPRLQSRTYSDQTVSIADYVAGNLRDRLAREKAHIHPYNVQIGPDKWFSGNGYYGITFGSIAPWYLERCDQFRCPKPDLSEANLKKEVQAVKTYMAKLDQQKIDAIQYWADKASWEDIAENYMNENQTPLKKRLEVRAVLLTALSDASGATFDSKYTYWVKRPHQIDSAINPIIPTPNHPSYPSAHSAVGKAAAVVLSSYFPENASNWDKMAQEAGASRLWAGVHYPMDHKEGVQLGERVGLQALKKQK